MSLKRSRPQDRPPHRSERGLLDSIQSGRDARSRARSFMGSTGEGETPVAEIDGSGDYLVFLDEGDPVYLPREILDWSRERQEPESFIKKIMRQFKIN